MLAMTIKKLFNDFNVRAVVASEIEFTLHSGGAIGDFWDDVKVACAAENIAIYHTEKERGRDQYEISLRPATPEKIIADTNVLKRIITDAAATHAMRADFSAKPFADDEGNGLHIHIHLEDENGKNLFTKDDEVMSDHLRFSLGGLLAWLPDTMPIFAPNPESYSRFAAGTRAPTTVSWGANNRTTALRLPDSEKNNKRIEHRVAGADADIEKVINIIFASIHFGIEMKIEPPAQIYGDASLAMYNLPTLPKTLKEARARMRASVLPLNISE